MTKKTALTLIFTIFIALNFNVSYAATTEETAYTTLQAVDINTFNEYKYRITAQYIDLRSKFEVTGKIDTVISGRILNLAETGYKYLPDNLINKNYFNYLKSAIERGQKYPENSSYFQDIATAIDDYLSKVNIQKVSGTVEAFPSSGNAPLTVSLRGNVIDPTGTKLENYNYTWWMNIAGKRVVIGNKVALSYVFKEEGNYSIFLDVTSNHKNVSGFTDVLPFSSRVNIEVREKIASIILKVNNITLGNEEELKFMPDEGRYGILFDATSSTPTSGARFTKTSWDFGNGIERDYDGAPKIERVVYASEGDYTVTLELRTNEGKTVTRKFVVRIHEPIASIYASSEEGYMGDKFTFTANPNSTQSNLSYSWRIIDIDNDVEMVAKNASTFTYTFADKGKYNVQLFVTEPSGEVDYDSLIVYINSRPPEAKFEYSIPNPNKPNTIFLDGSSSFDPDFTDDGKLTYSWRIDDMQNVELSSPNFNGSNGYYTFSSLGDHSVTLEVTDPDGMTSIKTEKINVNSLLSVDFNPFPRVSQIDRTVRFIADSPRAQYYEWDFGDGTVKGETSDTITHVYKRSGTFQVRLRVVDQNDDENTFVKNVFVGDADYPYPFITLKDNLQNEISYVPGECTSGAYVVNRVDTYTFSGDESLDVTGERYGVSYSWKLGNNYYSSQSFQKKFDELGCFKVRLTVTSEKTGKSASQEVNIKVNNMTPILGSLDVRPKDIETDPVIVDVVAQGAKDPDGVIQSYLWYYYTDADPEPQDFRSTRTNSTTFVIPRVAGNYYFAVVMRDSNEARINSEDINDSRYFVTLTGDNINTPLVSLSVNNNSVAIGDDVTFIAKVENVLLQDLSKVSSFSWDFDGDGFYDQETTSNTVTYKYKSSGQFHAKVRVKYKGYSNTKSLTIDVANILKPDFDYVSIGSSFIFFDTSLSNGANYEWDMGDGNKIVGESSFAYTYKDNNASHLVKLKLTEGTKIEEISKKVIKNMPNFMRTNKEELAIYSNFEINDDTITLSDNSRELYFYLTSNREDVANYVADYNINYDSDMNGGNDDDEDNKYDENYTDGSPILIEIDSSRTQIVRLYLKNADGLVIASKDITIVKEYIEEDVDLNSIVFEGVSDSTRIKIDRIKNIVSNFPQEPKLRSMMYIQRLQEEWNDLREKTMIIIEFENYLSEVNPIGANDVTDLLESLLIEEENGNREKEVAYTALKNLVPLNIECVGDSLLEANEKQITCYNLLISKLDLIYENANIPENRVIGLSILENIAETTTMTTAQKIDFKAILNTFVYGSSVNVPEADRDEVIEAGSVEEGGGIVNTIIDIVLILLKIFAWTVGIIGVLIGLFYAYYKIANKDPNKGFTDFIAEKTGGVKKEQEENKSEDILGNPLGDIESNVEENVDNVIEEQENVALDNTATTNEIEGLDESQVPDWLKGINEDNSPNAIPNETEIETNNTLALEETSEQVENNSPSLETEDNIEDNKEEESPIQSETNEGNIPDWLKGSFSEEEKPTENIVEDTIIPEASQNVPKIVVPSEPRLETKEELDEFTKLEENTNNEPDIPDWLKGAFTDETSGPASNEVSSTELKESNKEEVSKESEVSVKENEVKVKENNVNKEDTKENRKPRRRKRKPKTSENGNRQEVKKEEGKRDNKKAQTKKETEAEKNVAPDTELWDDGMKIPDWLKTDDEK